MSDKKVFLGGRSVHLSWFLCVCGGVGGLPLFWLGGTLILARGFTPGPIQGTPSPWKGPRTRDWGTSPQ